MSHYFSLEAQRAGWWLWPIQTPCTEEMLHSMSVFALHAESDEWISEVSQVRDREGPQGQT